MKFTKVLSANSYTEDIKKTLKEVDETLKRVAWQFNSYKHGIGYTGIMTDDKARLSAIKTALNELIKIEKALDNGDYLPNYEIN